MIYPWWQFSCEFILYSNLGINVVMAMFLGIFTMMAINPRSSQSIVGYVFTSICNGDVIIEFIRYKEIAYYIYLYISPLSPHHSHLSTLISPLSPHHSHLSTLISPLSPHHSHLSTLISPLSPHHSHLSTLISPLSSFTLILALLSHHSHLTTLILALSHHSHLTTLILALSSHHSHLSLSPHHSHLTITPIAIFTLNHLSSEH